MSQLDAVKDLLQRLPPCNVLNNYEALSSLLPERQKELRSIVDHPLHVSFDESSKREFICCEYNREADSYRSPWTNSFQPALEHGGSFPPPHLRELELETNAVYNEYRRMYYGDGVSSVYFWEIPNGFAGCFAIKKVVEGEELAAWDVIHLISVEQQGCDFLYALSSALLVSADSVLKEYGRGAFHFDGGIRHQATEARPLGEGHIVNIGKMIEASEANLRGRVGEMYISKTRDVLHALRFPEDEIRPSGL